MNERILELRTQAATWVAENHQPKDPNAYSQKEIDQRYLMYEEKFAELIVRECIGIVEPSSYRRAYPENYRGGIDCLETLEERAAKIKEHFGLKND